MITAYRYTGPNSAITLKVSDGAGGLKDQDVILWTRQNVDLPDDHEVTLTMLHQGLLAPISEAQTPAPMEDKADKADAAAAVKPKATK